MPNRIIRESIRESYSVDSLSSRAEITFYRLITYADDFGYFKCDPRLVNRALFPLRDYNELEVADWLDEISSSGMIRFYVGGDGKPYGYFCNWSEYQTIRNSKPKYPDKDGCEVFDSTDQLLKSIESSCNQVKSTASKSCRNPIQSNPNRDPNPNRDKVTLPRVPPCPHKEIINIYHEKLPTLSQVRVWGDDNKKQLRGRWRENKECREEGYWAQLFEYISKSPFLMGDSAGDWQCNLSWIVTKKNFNKILNGNYHKGLGKNLQAYEDFYEEAMKR